MLSKLPQPVRHTVSFIRHYGIGMALREAVPYLREVVTGRDQAAERVEGFDKRYGTDTDGEVWPWELSQPTGKRDAYQYQAATVADVQAAIRQVDGPITERVFLDLGSGKGRPSLVASLAPFKRVVGVELSRELHEAAESNLERFRTRATMRAPVTFMCDDATTLVLPDDPLLLFLYNPFGEATMSAVIANLELSLARNPRPVTVVYVNPLFSRAWRAAPGFRTLEDTKSRLVIRYRTAD
jgi:predicted RNA methylase